ncbi:MAG: SUMF1/EgtB/PvdO family nonheme iron enzyme [Roseiflexaceae bacterium]
MDDIQAKIAQLEALRPVLGDIATDAAIAALRATQGGAPVVAGPASAARDINIATQQTIHNAPVLRLDAAVVQAFFGTRPAEQGETLLAAYLDALCAECDRLHLHRLTGRRQTGSEQGTAPQLRLQQVYTSLTTGAIWLSHERIRTVAQLRRLVDRLKLDQRTPETAPPERVLWFYLNRPGESGLPNEADLAQLHLLPPDELRVRWSVRPELVLRAVADEPRLVLLGEPGSGKSTALRYLALLLARRLRGSTERIPGWPDDAHPVPILCPLGRVAAALPAHGGNADRALAAVLGDLLEGEHGLRAGLRDHLRPALRGDGVLLLFDGLDELPASMPDGRPGPRALFAQAIRRLAGETRARIVITSRVLPYRAEGDWQMPGDEGWQTRMIEPLAFGQVRVFVRSWYAALAESDPALTPKQAAVRAEVLLSELENSSTLRPLVTSPLLLTMLAILHYNTDEVPRDRAKLYHECVQLLLERWEPQRSPGQERAGLLERLGNLPGLDLDLLRGQIHALAFQAHSTPPGEDGRGLLDRDALENRMRRFFKTLRAPDPSGAVDTLVQVLREDAGLLLERGDGQYALPHLTFQEYLAACHLADQPDMAELVEERWHGPDAERWREVLRLLVGRLRQQGKVHNQALPWLQRLIAPRLGKQPKMPQVRRRDALLALLVYRELGPAALATSPVDVEGQIEAPLRAALVDLLAEPDPAVPVADRVQAGFLLGELGDPRFPVTIEEWRREIARARAGDTGGYFCRVEAGTYWIGSDDSDPDARPEEKPRHQVTFERPFWIARFPITNAQWWEWVAQGGQTTPGLTELDPDRLNQPLVWATNELATTFCHWLSKQIGVLARLPSEAEWEAAARGPEVRRYPWGNEWLSDRAASREESGIRVLRWIMPVGCYPAGAAACGALDLAGNVWEYTASPWQSYPDAVELINVQGLQVIRGGSYLSKPTTLRCAVRDHNNRRGGGGVIGFRIVVEL